MILYALAFALLGSSPRVRGSLDLGALATGYGGIIPAGAGLTPFSAYEQV